jgi:hypothetical protein
MCVYTFTHIYTYINSDDSGEPVDFTLDEYKEFQALTHKEVEDWTPDG